MILRWKKNVHSTIYEYLHSSVNFTRISICKAIVNKNIFFKSEIAKAQTNKWKLSHTYTNLTQTHMKIYIKSSKSHDDKKKHGTCAAATFVCTLELSYFTTIYNHINDVTKSKLLSTCVRLSTVWDWLLNKYKNRTH